MKFCLIAFVFLYISRNSKLEGSVLKPSNEGLEKNEIKTRNFESAELVATEEEKKIRFERAFWDTDDGSGDLVPSIAKPTMVVRKNLKGFLPKKSALSSDFTFDNEKENETDTEGTGKETQSPDITIESSSDKPITTVSSGSSSSTQAFNCDCSAWENYTAMIKPNHIIAMEGVTFELNCFINHLESSDTTLPQNWKIIWNLDRYKDDQDVKVLNPNLTVSNATESDSGTYYCLLETLDTCCHKETYTLVNIYKKPNYAMHLIITGAICGVQIIACIPFALYTRNKMKNLYKKDKKETEDEQKLIA